MSWAAAVTGLVDGFATGYKFIEDIEAGREEREQRSRALDLQEKGYDYEQQRIDLAREAEANQQLYRTQSLDINRGALDLNREEFEAGAPGRAATTAVNQETAEKLELENKEKRLFWDMLGGTTSEYMQMRSEATGGASTTTPTTTPAPDRRSALPIGSEQSNLASNALSYMPTTSGDTGAGASAGAGAIRTPEERDLAIRMIAMEASGEPEEGKQAVANV